MKVADFMPVHGRTPLLIHTINRLYRVNRVDLVVCAGDDPEDKAVCAAVGAEWVYADNQPLGAKCNAALKKLAPFDPDYVVMSFSSDWISSNWIPTLISNIGDADLIGTKDCYFMQVTGSGKQEKHEWIHWGGYVKSSGRLNEPIGGGRIFTGRICKALNWELFENNIDLSLDYSSTHRVIAAGGKVKCIEDPSIKILSIGTDRWINKHNFNNEKDYPTSTVLTHKKIHDMYNLFPEAKQIFNR